jgi:uncharacterized protein YecT (DUF1311 family)
MVSKSWFVLLFSAGVLANAASFDCAKAKTQQEKAICASPALSAVDDQMAAAYWKTLAATPSEFKAGIREDQRTWLRSVALHCNPSVSDDLSQCLLSYENARKDALQHMVFQRGGITFVSRSIILTEPDEDKFQLGQEVNPGYGTLTASWPQAAINTPEWKAWNEAVESEVKKVAGSSAQSAMDDDAWVAMGLVGKELITATVSYLEDGHGAHPNQGSVEFNWLLKEQRELKSDDIFLPGSGWEEVLQLRTDEYLRRVLDGGPDYEPGEMEKVLHPIVVNPRNWKLDGAGLAIIFKPYAVTCYACTPGPFKMPWSELKPLLKDDFVIPVSDQNVATAQ